MAFHKIAVLNGHFLPLREVRLDPSSGGVLFGWGVYTTVRLYEGHPFNIEAHVRRVEHDAAAVGIPLPQALRTVEADIADLARRNGGGDGIARILLLGGPSDRYSSQPLTDADMLILTRDLRPPRPGESVQVSPWRLHTSNPLVGVKVTSNLIYVQCRRQAMAEQFDEALILNESEHVVEVSTGNVFWVRDGVLHTPGLASGCLPGSTRDIVIELARVAGIEVVEGGFGVEELRAADEAFVTSVSREVSAVARVDDRTFPETPGPMAQTLGAAFAARVREWLDGRPDPPT